MPVIEYGEMGVLVKPDESNKLVIHWRVTAKQVALLPAKYGGINGWKIGDPIYKTSMGWIEGNLDKSDYFEPTERERSLKPCINRAYDYAMKKWPKWRNETH
jgi:hypothetical protein